MQGEVKGKITDYMALGVHVLCWAPELCLAGCREPFRIATPLCLAPYTQAVWAARPPSSRSGSQGTCDLDLSCLAVISEERQRQMEPPDP